MHSLPSLTLAYHYQLGLFLFHSPLLKKSLLFFLPSLIDMLKLRESSYKFQVFLKIQFIIFSFYNLKMLLFNLLKYLYYFLFFGFYFCKIFLFILYYFLRDVETYIHRSVNNVLSCIQNFSIRVLSFLLLIAIHCVLHRPGN